MDIDSSRLAARTPAGHRLYLIAGDGVIGMYDQNGGGGVGLLRDAVAGEVVGIDIVAPRLKPDHIRVHGILPDDAEHVTVISCAGERWPLTVQENVYVFEVPRRPVAGLPETIEWTTGDGRHSVPVDLPPDIPAVERTPANITCE